MSDPGIIIDDPTPCLCRSGHGWHAPIPGGDAMRALIYSKGDGEWLYTVGLTATRTVGGFEYQGDAQLASRHAAVALLASLDAVRARIVAGLEADGPAL